MIKIENAEVYGMDRAILAARNPLDSWDLADSIKGYDGGLIIGEKDMHLMQKLVKSGTEHAKFMRMIYVTVDVTAPLFWWKEAETYKVGTVSNSCSTMHTLHKNEITTKDFSREGIQTTEGRRAFMSVIYALERLRNTYNDTGEKKYWREMIELLPSSYNQMRTISLNYAVLRNIYFQRRGHKLTEWRQFCEWIESLPYGKELICLESK